MNLFPKNKEKGKFINFWFSMFGEQWPNYYEFKKFQWIDATEFESN